MPLICYDNHGVLDNVNVLSTYYCSFNFAVTLYITSASMGNPNS
jgi:hypothetical protein